MNIRDILVTPLRRVDTIGGDVLHGIKQSDPGYTQMTMNVVVPVGKVRFVFRRVNSEDVEELRVEEIGEDRYVRLTVPPGIWFGFQGLGTPQSLVMNIASIPHDPNEVERMLLSDINYKWN
jgi:dTDP-4-dehydrorhamnose 3,5-epimerase